MENNRPYVVESLGWNNTTTTTISTRNVTAVTKVRSASFTADVASTAHFANCFIFLVTWGLAVTIFHSTCIFCVFSMGLYWPTLHFYVCVYVSFVCWYVAPSAECYYNTVMLRVIFITACGTFSALCVYSKFGYHPHPLSYLCAKLHFFRSLHCWASLWRKIAYAITQ